MDVQSLVGLSLESFRFSRSSYTFEFDGTSEGEHRRFLVSTPFYLCSLNSPELIDAESDCSHLVWGFLENELRAVEVDEERSRVTFSFENGGSLVVWGDEPLVDNLLVVTDANTGAWFTVL